MDKVKRTSWLLIASCAFVFMMSIAIKWVYNSSLISIRAEYGLTYSQTRIGSAIYYVSYAVFQVLLAIFIKKINIKKVFFISIILSSVTYTLLAFVGNLWVLWSVMAINGALQAPHWSGCIYFIAKYMRKEYVGKANAFLAITNPLGTALSAGVVALFVYFNAWKLSFVVFGVGMILSAFLFKYAELQAEKHLGAVEVKRRPTAGANAGVSYSKKEKRSFLLIVLYVAFCSMIATGVGNAVKSSLSDLLFDVHNLNESLSILITIFLPLLAAAFKIFAFKLCDRQNGDVAKVNLWLACGGVLFVGGLSLTFANSLVACIILPVFAYSVILSIASIFGSYFSLRMRDKFNPGATSAITNAFGSVGTGCMPYLSALFLDIGGLKGYRLNFLFLFALMVTVTGLIFILHLTKKKNPLMKDLFKYKRKSKR